ncbi:hypothetical protein [Sphingopyxis fribergensis]
MGGPLNKDEIVSYLANSTLPTLVVEGRDDMSFLRPIEKQIKGLDILVADGKDAALHVLDSIDNIECPIAILVDLDFWSIDGIPPQYEGRPRLIVTDGYSIENDLIRDANLFELLHGPEIDRFHRAALLLSKWFACCRFSKNFSKDRPWNARIKKVISLEDLSYEKTALTFMTIFSVEPERASYIFDNFHKFFRGKSLKSLYQLFFSTPNRQPNLEVGSLMAGAWVGNGAFVTRIRTEIRDILLSN